MSPRSSIKTVGNRALNARYLLVCQKSVLLARNKIYHKFASNVKQILFAGKEQNPANPGNPAPDNLKNACFLLLIHDKIKLNEGVS